MRLFDPHVDAADTAVPGAVGEAPAEPQAGPEPAPASTAPEASPTGPLRRVMLLVAYDGGPFHGFAFQPRQPTVAGRLAEAIGRLAGHAVTLVCAGRTDSGVHAAGQVVHVDVAESFWGSDGDPARVSRSLSHQVGPEVAVLDVRRAPEGFDARHAALARRYRYLVLRSPAPDPLLRHITWHVPADLDLAAMRIGADALLGEHDFAAFCRRPAGGGSLVRRVTDSSVRVDAPTGLLAIEIEANAFCHQMVRSLVGVLVSVGEGRLPAASVLEILRSRDRSRGSRLAPPEGLCLMTVQYPDEMVPGGVWRAPAVPNVGAAPFLRSASVA